MGFDKKKRIPDKYKKIDTSLNGDVDELVENHKEVEQKLYPLPIKPGLIIYVPKHKHNEEYKKKWMQRNGITEKGISLKHCMIESTDEKMANILEVTKQMLKEGYCVKDVCEKLKVRDSFLYKFLKENYITIPKTAERIAIFKEKGMTIEEMAERTNLSISTVKSYLKQKNSI